MSRGKLDPFTVDHFREWAKPLELDNGEPWIVDDWFLSFVEDVFAGFRQAWLIVPEGNAKTTGLAGLALYHCEFTPHAFVPWAASARDQAEIGYTQAKVFVSSMPKNRRPRCYDGYRKIRFANGSEIKVFAAGAEHADGVIPTLPMVDELHRHKNLSLYRTWAGKLDKRGGQLLTISTAGEPGSDFEATRDKIRKQATDVSETGAYGRYATDRVVLHEFAVRDEKLIEDMAVVKAANPSPRITVESLAEKRSDPTMTEAHWRRFTCNIATADEGRELFIDPQAWAACGGGPPILDGATVCIGADGSRKWDTTVVAWATALEDRIDVACCVFSAREGIPFHVLHPDQRIDFGDVESFLLELFGRFHPLQTAYDPRYLERSMEVVDERLSSSDVIPVEPHSKHARDAYQALFTAVLDGRIRHGDDPVIAAHLANCGVDRDDRTREIRRLRKIDARKPIDAVPALALAVWRATLAEPSKYETSDLVMV
jgi:phage terminase large subunit-like protein